MMRWQQLTGPIVAKGLEDTALYVYYPLLSLNEVGGRPSLSSIVSREEFYELMQERLRRWPHSLNATINTRYQAERGYSRAFKCSFGNA